MSNLSTLKTLILLEAVKSASKKKKKKTLRVSDSQDRKGVKISAMTDTVGRLFQMIIMQAKNENLR